MYHPVCVEPWGSSPEHQLWMERRVGKEAADVEVITCTRTLEHQCVPLCLCAIILSIFIKPSPPCPRPICHSQKAHKACQETLGQLEGCVFVCLLVNGGGGVCSAGLISVTLYSIISC